MVTSKEYINLLNSNKITNEIIGEVLYSINKRAKNHRDKKREYSKNNHYSRFDYAELSEEKEQEYYKMKSDILSLFNPTKIHLDKKHNSHKCKVYSYEPEYHKIKDTEIIRTGEFYDAELQEQIEFKVILKETDVNLYFLYYQIGEYDFHEPIQESDVTKYDLVIQSIEDFTTKGKDIKELLSTQFCNKVYKKLMNNELKIID